MKGAGWEFDREESSSGASRRGSWHGSRPVTEGNKEWKQEKEVVAVAESPLLLFCVPTCILEGTLRSVMEEVTSPADSENSSQ